MRLRYSLGIDDVTLAPMADFADPATFLAALAGSLEIDPAWLKGRFVEFPHFDWRKRDDDADDDATENRRLFASAQFDLEIGEAAELVRKLNDKGFAQRRDKPSGWVPETEDRAYSLAADPRLATMDTWSPRASGGAVFGDRARAHALIGANALGPDHPWGRGVNVVIVDRGISRTWVRRMRAARGLADDRAGHVLGWTRYAWNPGLQRRDYFNPGENASEHGHMIARSILALAPHARIWDAPLIPDPDAPPHLSTAASIFHQIKRAVRRRKLYSWDYAAMPIRQVKWRSGKLIDNRYVGQELDGAWIVVNAWGVLDTAERLFADGGYGSTMDHPWMRAISSLTADLRHAGEPTETPPRRIDVVFAAGNCGEPTPDPRCGEFDVGAGRGVHGINAHPNVLTVGAVQVDGLPVAQSSQGPGRVRFPPDAEYPANRPRKPDIAAPSYFREIDDGRFTNGGTSAACAMAAGVLAALRSLPDADCLTPRQMRSILRDNATPVDGAPWNPRCGHGAGRCRATSWLDGAPWNPRCGRGIINVPRALAATRTAISEAPGKTGP